MGTSTSLLLYGLDAGLLRTRQWLLKAAGYQVWIATDLSQVTRVASQEEVALLILCHTLSLEECGRAIAGVHSILPNVKSLTLMTGRPDADDCTFDERVDTADGPAKLISAVTELVDPEDNADLPSRIRSVPEAPQHRASAFG